MMRQVAFLTLPALEPGRLKSVALEPGTLENQVLEVCSALTPLVEPAAAGVFLDLNGCGQPEELLEIIAGGLKACGLSQCCLGKAGSKLAALLAAQGPEYKLANPARRVWTVRGLRVAEVEPGQDKVFMGHFRIEDFPLFKNNEARRLKRAGFRRIEDLQDMSGGQLGRLLGRRDVFELEQGLQARDGALVLGLYPPERLFYRRVFEPEIRDFKQLEEQLADASALLGRCLEERHASARRLFLRLHTGSGVLERERVLQIGCAGSSRLRDLLAGLLVPSGLNSDLSGLDICLERLEEVRLEQPGLFAATGQCESGWRERAVEDSLEKLLERFPEAVSKGLEMDWREQILALWDPWRFSSDRL